MLEVTEPAAEALRDLRRRSGHDPETPARVQLLEASDRDDHLVGVSFEDPPREGDVRVWDRGGLDVYVAHELVAPLAETVLEARRTDEGVELALRDRDPLAHAGHGPGEHHHHGHGDASGRGGSAGNGAAPEA